MGFLRDRWEDVRGNLLWQILVWACGGGLVTAIAVAVRAARNHPFEWHFVATVFVISVLALAVIFLLAARYRLQGIQPISGIQQSLAAAPTRPSILDTTVFFKEAYYSHLQPEIETNIRRAAMENQPDDREGFYAKFIAIGVIAYIYDSIWYPIYRSQLLALLDINRHSGLLPVAAVKAYYDQARIDYPERYATYSFADWLNFLKSETLVIQHPSDMIEITVRGKDFLKYLLHWGRDAAQKAF